MTKNDNLYIEALKEGRNNMKDGISFDELIKHLQSKGFEFSSGYLDYFRFWFYTNFYHLVITPHLKLSTPQSITILHEATVSNPNVDNEKCIITGEAYENLIDFENLQEARKSSKQANKLATWAIIISIILGVISVGVAVIQIYYSMDSKQNCQQSKRLFHHCHKTIK